MLEFVKSRLKVEASGSCDYLRMI